MESAKTEQTQEPDEPVKNGAFAKSGDSRESVEDKKTNIEQDVMIADSLTLYLHQMGAVREKLLTREQEVALAKKIEKGNFAAKTELIEANLRLVVSITKGRTDNSQEQLEMIQDGSLGLIRAAEKFDWRKGFKFSTYATWWIKQSVQRGREDKETTIRLPVHIRGEIRKIKRAQREHEAIYGVEPTLAELCELTGIDDPAKLQAFIDYDAFIKLIPLDKKLGDEGKDNVTIADFVQDHTVDIERDAEAGVEASKLDLIIGYCLNSTETKVIEMRHGMHGYNDPHTLDQIAKALDLTRERVRQIEKKAIFKLKEFAEATGMIEE